MICLPSLKEYKKFAGYEYGTYLKVYNSSRRIWLKIRVFLKVYLYINGMLSPNKNTEYQNVLF